MPTRNIIINRFISHLEIISTMTNFITAIGVSYRNELKSIKKVAINSSLFMKHFLMHGNLSKSVLEKNISSMV